MHEGRRSDALATADAEVDTPPYLQQALLRPSVTTNITNVQYGTSVVLTISLGDELNPAEQIDFATLIRCGSVTHHFDRDQRCIRLMPRPETAGSMLVLAPLPAANGTERGHYLAPPGYYMLFVVRKPTGSPAVRVPSVAKFVKVG